MLRRGHNIRATPATDWIGRTQLPSAVFLGLSVRPWSGLVAHPVGRRMSDSSNSGAGRGPFSSFRIAGAGVAGPVTCSHRAMAWARPQR